MAEDPKSLEDQVNNLSIAQAKADHAQRLANFYHQQRLDAETGAMSGDAKSKALAGKIGGKLVRGGNAEQQIEGRDALALSKGGRIADRAKSKGRTTGDTAKAASVLNDPVALGGDALGGAAAGLGRLFLGGMGQVARSAYPRVADELEGVSARMFGRDTTQAAERGPKVSAKVVRDEPKALPRSKSQPNVRANPKTTGTGATSRVQQAKNAAGRAKIGSKNKTPSTGTPKQQALNKGRDTGPDFKQPKVVRARTPRAKQTSPRAKGTNPRAARKKAAAGAS